MKTFDAHIAKINIIKYYNRSGLTVEAFANILDISDRWFKLVNSPRNNYVFDVDSIKKASYFFGVDFNKFTSVLLSPQENLRESLQKLHSKNPEFSKILSDPPSLPFIVNNILIQDKEFKSSAGLELKDVKTIIKKYYPKINLSNLSKTLQNSDSVNHWSHPSKRKPIFIKEQNESEILIIKSL